MQEKIKNILTKYPNGLVLQSSFLEREGYSYVLQQHYRKSGLLKLIGKGAMLKSDNDFLIFGALASLQQQSNHSVHIGGRTALALSGQAHYLQINMQSVSLFKEPKDDLPKWFLSNQWDLGFEVFNISLFEDKSAGYKAYEGSGLALKISNPARALMECLSLCPDKFPLIEGYEIMENLLTLRPSVVQTLLEQCKSIKVKRLFLYFAEKVGHSWFEDLDTSKIELGTGARRIVSNGKYVSKYELMLPEELV
ncbi:hypothetical protein FACS189413_19060 [Bacteroidia bacterium]|nr:hypothetical protein FACS189413_19060 [Bacteroidia bacterium]